MMYLFLLGLALQIRTPNEILDLSHWKLTLPVNASGGSSGSAMTIGTAALLNGYHSDYFFCETGNGPGSSGGGVTFWSPAAGATTPHSLHPRTELREMPGDWTMTDSGSLRATLRVSQVPSGSRTIVVGQIHGNGSAPPLLLLFYTNLGGKGVLKAGVHDALDHPLHDYPLSDDIPMGSTFSYLIRVTGSGYLLVSVDGGAPVRVPIDLSWKGKGLYFKAGDYVQSSAAGPSDPEDGGKVTFYALFLAH